MSSRLIDRSLSEFTDVLAARTATPGGGSMAAYLAACGAALVAMASRFSQGEKFAAVAPAMARRAAALDELRPKALALVDRDAASYDAVTAAYGLPKASPAEKETRTRAIQRAMQGALEVPFETMEIALAGLELAAEIAPSVNPNLKSDCAVGARCLSTALDGAFFNVRINADSIHDAAYVDSRLRESERMRTRARELASQVARAVEPGP